MATIWINPIVIPTNHTGLIAVVLTGSAGTFVSGTTVFTLIGAPAGTAFNAAGAGFISGTTSHGDPSGFTGTNAVVYISTSATAGTFTISDGTTTSVTASVVAATLAINILNNPTPNGTIGIPVNTHAPIGTTPNLYVFGTSQVWSQETAAGLFTISGLSNTVGTPVSIVTLPGGNNAAVLPITLLTTSGAATITDTSTGATATLTVDAVSTPAPATASPGSQYSNLPTLVTLSCATAGAKIYYNFSTASTQNGVVTAQGAPTNASTLYSAPINVPAGAILKTITYDAGNTIAGSVLTYTYFVQQYLPNQQLSDVVGNRMPLTEGHIAYVANTGASTANGGASAGATTLVLNSVTGFATYGGYVTIPGQNQPVVYTGISTLTLTGIPAAGYGAINVAVSNGAAVAAQGTYFWYGKNRTGITTNAVIANQYGLPVDVYTSPDAFNWLWNAHLVTNATTFNALGRAHVSLSGSTFVMTLNRKLFAAVATAVLDIYTASTPVGPFTTSATGLSPGSGPFDSSSFTDASGNIWVVYNNALTNVQVAQVNGSFTALSAATTIVASNLEAPGIFYLNGVYYLILSLVSGFANTECQYYTATTPAGTWTSQGEFIAPSGLTTRDNLMQCSSVFRWPGTTDYMLVGDAWNAGALTATFPVWIPVTAAPSGVATGWQATYMGTWSPFGVYPQIVQSVGTGLLSSPGMDGGMRA